ncbi:MAG: NADAR family protein [Simkaniaceae bacterium]|nr:NADAR family protein [Simkaniaceae bacterium]
MATGLELDFTAFPQGALFVGSKWEPLTELSSKKPLKVFETTAKALLSAPEDILTSKLALPFIRKFNTAWTTAQIVQKKITAPARDATGELRFNSYGKYAWLSNFFPTIIVDQAKKRVYGTIEAGYVAFKADLAGEAEIPTEVCKTIDGKSAKRMGTSIARPPEPESLIEMERLVRLKFEQNAKAAELLSKTAPLHLSEHTADVFWGNGNGSVSGAQNHMGRITERVRASLNEAPPLPPTRTRKGRRNRK